MVFLVSLLLTAGCEVRRGAARQGVARLGNARQGEGFTEHKI